MVSTRASIPPRNAGSTQRLTKPLQLFTSSEYFPRASNSLTRRQLKAPAIKDATNVLEERREPSVNMCDRWHEAYAPTGHDKNPHAHLVQLARPKPQDCREHVLRIASDLERGIHHGCCRRGALWQGIWLLSHKPRVPSAKFTYSAESRGGAGRYKNMCVPRSEERGVMSNGEVAHIWWARRPHCCKPRSSTQLFSA